MKLDSLCKGELNVEAVYISEELNSIKFFANGNLIQADTVISSKGMLFYVSHYSIGTENLARVTAVLNDTTRTFVFSRNSINYELAFIETPVSESSIKIQITLPATFFTYDFNLSSLIKLREKHKYMEYFPNYLQIDYNYSPNSLIYEVLEFHPEIGGYGGGNRTERIVNFYNCMYLDIISFEDRILLPLSKQLRRNFL